MNIKKLFCCCLTALFSVASLPPAQGQTPSSGLPDDISETAQSIIEKADRVRFPSEGFQVAVRISSKAAGREADVRKYRVLSKGNENTIVMTIEPASERGQTLLMKSRDLWLFMPNVSQPVRLSVAQRMAGEVSYGDVARANFAGDYAPKILRTETIGEKNYYVLELTAVDRGVTYGKVIYWVKQGDYHPLKAEFYSMSGRLLKTCTYEEYKALGGQIRPTRLVMEDALKKGETSLLEYDELKMRDLPDHYFSKDYLKKLE